MRGEAKKMPGLAHVDDMVLREFYGRMHAEGAQFQEKWLEDGRIDAAEARAVLDVSGDGCLDAADLKLLRERLAALPRRGAFPARGMYAQTADALFHRLSERDPLRRAWFERTQHVPSAEHVDLDRPAHEAIAPICVDDYTLSRPETWTRAAEEYARLAALTGTADSAQGLADELSRMLAGSDADFVLNELIPYACYQLQADMDPEQNGGRIPWHLACATAHFLRSMLEAALRLPPESRPSSFPTDLDRLYADVSRVGLQAFQLMEGEAALMPANVSGSRYIPQEMRPYFVFSEQDGRIVPTARFVRDGIREAEWMTTGIALMNEVARVYAYVEAMPEGNRPRVLPAEFEGLPLEQRLHVLRTRIAPSIERAYHRHFAKYPETGKGNAEYHRACLAEIDGDFTRARFLFRDAVRAHERNGVDTQKPDTWPADYAQARDRLRIMTGAQLRQVEAAADMVSRQVQEKDGVPPEQQAQYQRVRAWLDDVRERLSAGTAVALADIELPPMPERLGPFAIVTQLLQAEAHADVSEYQRLKRGLVETLRKGSASFGLLRGNSTLAAALCKQELAGVFQREINRLTPIRRAEIHAQAQAWLKESRGQLSDIISAAVKKAAGAEPSSEEMEQILQQQMAMHEQQLLEKEAVRALKANPDGLTAEQRQWLETFNDIDDPLDELFNLSDASREQLPMMASMLLMCVPAFGLGMGIVRSGLMLAGRASPMAAALIGESTLAGGFIVGTLGGAIGATGFDAGLYAAGMSDKRPGMGSFLHHLAVFGVFTATGLPCSAQTIVNRFGPAGVEALSFASGVATAFALDPVLNPADDRHWSERLGQHTVGLGIFHFSNKYFESLWGHGRRVQHYAQGM